MAYYIYSRVSTDGQSTDSQITALVKKYQGAEVVTETRSGAKTRPFLNALLEQLREGDTLVVAALDRLGRKATEILVMIEDLQRRGVNLISDREGVDYSTAVGRLATQILASCAEMERNVIIERTKAGLAAARAKGKLIGRKPYIPQNVISEARRLVAEGMSVRKAAAAVGISHTHLNDLLKKNPLVRVDELRLEREHIRDLVRG
jgi:DNA invertase Pin-like site-specific DNA recombinase